MPHPALADLLPWLPLPEQVRLCRTSASLRASCLHHVRHWGTECWNRVKTIVAERLALRGPPRALLAHCGVGEGTHCRALGCALDVVETLRPEPLPADVALLALAVVRYSLKFELSGEQLEAMVEHFRAGGCLHLPHVQEVECVLVMRVAPAIEL